MAERKQFTFYRSYYEAIKVLPKQQQTTVLMAICAYALDGEEPNLSGTLAAIFALVKPTLDASKRKADNGAAGGRPKANETKQKANETKQKANGKQTESKKEEEKEKEGEIEKEREKEYECTPPTPSHKYGAYGWVKLTDEQYARLLHDLGQAELERCIAYVDESAQGNGNKNKWKDWNLVVRRCHREGWGKNKASNSGFDTGNPFLEMLSERRGNA